MKPLSIKKLQESFVGKVCTVLTVTGNAGFQNQQFSDFFTGIIESIDEDGIFARHHLTGCRMYFVMSYVVSLLLEQTISEDDPKFKEIVTEVTKRPTEGVVPVVPQSDYVDAEYLRNMTLKASQGKMLRKQ